MNHLKRKSEILAALLSIASWPAFATAQTPPIVKQVETNDGSRFLLVPWGSSPLIHWVMAAPAGTAEDPPEYPGLSFAVARASLSGTRELGTRDWLANEMAILTREDLEMEKWRIESDGGTPDATLLAEIDKSRRIADQLSDPFAWRRELLAAPAIDLQLSEADAVSLLSVTCTSEGLPRVAQLLKLRRDDAALRGLREAYRQVRTERAQRQRHPLSAIRHEILELALPVNIRAGESIDRNLYRLGIAVFKRSQVPGRCLHVITGGFDLPKLEAVLHDVFDGNENHREPPVEPAEWNVRKEHELSSTIPGGDRYFVALAHQIPRQTKPQALAILTDWLSQGPDSFLARGLRALGHRNLQVQGQAPFPGTSTPGLLLVEVWEERVPSPGQAPRKIESTIKKLLAAAADLGPTLDEFNQAAARARGLRSKALSSPLDLAHHLALACSVMQQSPTQAMRTTVHVTRGEVHELARKLLVDSQRSIVSIRRRR